MNKLKKIIQTAQHQRKQEKMLIDGKKYLTPSEIYTLEKNRVVQYDLAVELAEVLSKNALAETRILDLFSFIPSRVIAASAVLIREDIESIEKYKKEYELAKRFLEGEKLLMLSREMNSEFPKHIRRHLKSPTEVLIYIATRDGFLFDVRNIK